MQSADRRLARLPAVLQNVGGVDPACCQEAQRNVQGAWLRRSSRGATGREHGRRCAHSKRCGRWRRWFSKSYNALYNHVGEQMDSEKLQHEMARIHQNCDNWGLFSPPDISFCISHPSCRASCVPGPLRRRLVLMACGPAPAVSVNVLTGFYGSYRTCKNVRKELRHLAEGALPSCGFPSLSGRREGHFVLHVCLRCTLVPHC